MEENKELILYSNPEEEEIKKQVYEKKKELENLENQLNIIEMKKKMQSIILKINNKRFIAIIIHFPRSITGWKWTFGIDIIHDEENDIYLNIKEEDLTFSSYDDACLARAYIKDNIKSSRYKVFHIGKID